MSTKKKVHAIVKYFYPVTAGIEVNMLETYSVLADKGWDVTIHTSKDTYIEKDCLPESEKYRGLTIRRYSFKSWGFFPNIDWNSTKLICFHNFDIFPHFILLVYLSLRNLIGNKISVVLTPHGGFSLSTSLSTFPWWQRVIKRTYHKTLAPLLINFTVDRIRAVSEWEKEEMIKDGVRKELIKVISNGIEDAAYSDLEKKASDSIKKRVGKWGRYIIQIGRIYPIKNYETAIKALNYIPSDIKYVIIGPVEKNKNPGYWKSLQKLISDQKLEERVIFAGVIKGFDKFYALKHAQLMVHMAIWESFCIVVLEGISQGLPIIAANNTALPFLVKDDVNGYLVDTKDYKKVAERVNYILKNVNSKKIMKIKEVNRKFAKEHAWSRVAKKMDSLYRSLI